MAPTTVNLRVTLPDGHVITVEESQTLGDDGTPATVVKAARAAMNAAFLGADAQLDDWRPGHPHGRHAEWVDNPPYDASNAPTTINTIPPYPR